MLVFYICNMTTALRLFMYRASAGNAPLSGLQELLGRGGRGNNSITDHCI